VQAIQMTVWIKGLPWQLKSPYPISSIMINNIRRLRSLGGHRRQQDDDSYHDLAAK
jgi:hypothetical protein